jgi:hypothetical protein
MSFEIIPHHYLREKVEEVLAVDLLCLFLRFLTVSISHKELTRLSSWAAFL